MDITVFNAGSIIILSGATPAGRDWLAEHMPADCQRWGTGYAVEPRYVQDILDGAMADGLVVES